MLILYLWGISFHPVVVVGLGNNLLFNFIVGHCVVSGYSWIFSCCKNNLLHFTYIVIIYTTMYLFISICSTKSKIVVQIAQKSRSFHFSNASKAETILTQLFFLFEALCSATHIEFYSKILSGNLLTWQNILYFYYRTHAIITHGYYFLNPLFRRICVIGKVLTFWIGNKNLKQSPTWFDIY